MFPGQNTDAPHKSKGLVPTILTSIGVFLAIAAIPLFSQNGSLAAPVNSVADGIKSNWVIADDRKSINFEFSHDGGDYSGQFDIWNAQIEF